MITNLLAGIMVTISTNVADRVTGFANYVPGPCPDFKHVTNGLYFSCAALHLIGENPNEITTTTTCERRTVLEFEWMGAVRKVEHVEVLWQSNVVKKLEWIVKP